MINADNTNKCTKKQWNKNELLHLYFDDILVVGRASIQQNMLGNLLAICMFFIQKIQTFLLPPACLLHFSRQNLRRTKQFIDCGLMLKVASQAAAQAWTCTSPESYTYKQKRNKMYFFFLSFQLDRLINRHALPDLCLMPSQLEDVTK